MVVLILHGTSYWFVEVTPSLMHKKHWHHVCRLCWYFMHSG